MAAAVVALLQSSASAVSGRVSTTCYVGRHFEIRDHDQPTKYVFNGSTRVAAITGSLSSNMRLQRLRLFPGWNLCSLAVSGAFPASGAEAVAAAYQWNVGTADYSPITLGQTLAAGTVLWVKASTNAVVSILGSYTEPVAQPLPPGGAYVPGAGLEAWAPALPDLVSSWEFEGLTAQWSDYLPALAGISAPPPILSPGQAFYVQTGAPEVLQPPDSALRIHYYHEDHLGSSSVITDASGALVEESTFYPFGHSRNELRRRQVHDPYQFAQKEQDLESRLDYFGKRFYSAALGRWLSPDPLEEKGGSLNLYGYAKENPLKYFDPTGGEVNVAFDKASSTYTISVKAVLVDYSPAHHGRHLSAQQLQDYADKLKDTIVSSFSGQEGEIKWKTVVDLKVIDPSVAPDKNDHVFRIVDHTKNGSAGSAYIGGKVMDIEAAALWSKRPSELTQEERDNPRNKDYDKFYQSPETVGAHEQGHTLGLPHVAENTLMHGGVREHDVAKVSRKEIETIYKQFKAGKLNQDDEALARKGKPAD
jgi:RHS repeat-associated protein